MPRDTAGAWPQLVLAAALAAAALQVVAVQAAAAPECALPLGGDRTVPFEHCMLVPGIGDGFTLHWDAPAANGTALMSWGLSTAATGGYISLAYPAEPGVMVGAAAFALQACSSCPSGAQLKEYHLGGYASGDMQAPAHQLASGAQAAATPEGLAATFMAPLPAGSDPAALPLIFAAGAVYPNGMMRQHETYGEGVLDLIGGALSDTEADSRSISTLVAAHLWLLLIGWGVLIPLGVVIARNFKAHAPLWFKLHRALMVVGTILGIVGLALGFIISGGWNTLFGTHRDLGLAALIIGLAQLPALKWRPTLTSPRRRAWNLGHWWLGRTAVLLAVANIYYGFIDVLGAGVGAWAGYTAVFALIVAVSIGKESWAYLHLPPRGGMHDSGKLAADGAAGMAGTSTSQAMEVSLAETAHSQPSAQP